MPDAMSQVTDINEELNQVLLEADNPTFDPAEILHCLHKIEARYTQFGISVPESLTRFERELRAEMYAISQGR